MQTVMIILAGYVNGKITRDQAREQLCDDNSTCREDVVDVMIDAIDRGQFKTDFILSFVK